MHPIAPPREREGYEVDYGAPRHRVSYNLVSCGGPSIEIEPWWKRPATEAQLGLLMFGGGAIWAAKVETVRLANIFQLLTTTGPVEIAAIGLLVWLHAKWRKSIRVK